MLADGPVQLGELRLIGQAQVEDPARAAAEIEGALPRGQADAAEQVGGLRTQLVGLALQPGALGRVAVRRDGAACRRAWLGTGLAGTSSARRGPALELGPDLGHAAVEVRKGP